MYVYIESEKGLWTVGFYDPSGKWNPESDHNSADAAAKRVVYLNGANVSFANEPPKRRRARSVLGLSFGGTE